VFFFQTSSLGAIRDQSVADDTANWEYQPSSQFFLDYSDGRDTLGSGMPDLLNRSFAVKITRLLRF
jgi:hypothetical protein